MIARVSQVMGGIGLAARVLRSSSWILLGYGGGQAIRLLSNLILTRLLYPEAFGVIALVTMITVGLTLFSDVGIGPSISRSARGDDPNFLNTAWTIQILRGFGLFIAACLLAAPVASFYAEPDLALYIPVAALAMIISGFNPTRIEQGYRHLLTGLLTGLTLLSQSIGVIAMIALVLIWPTPLSLVIGNLIGVLSHLLLTHFTLPGDKNKLRFEGAAAKELTSFGKWIFLSTVFWFFASQGDKAILGKILTLDDLGIYNIGYFLASFPFLLGTSVTGRIMIPIYRATPDSMDRRLVRMRFGITGGVLCLLAIMSLIGPWLVSLLYDARYLHSGAIVVVLSLALMPQVIGMTYDQAALANGDSRRFFIYSAVRSSLQVGMLLVGALYYGLIGALVGLGLAAILSHGVLIWLARIHKAWDYRHDGLYALCAVGIASLALWLHMPAIRAMAIAMQP